MNDETVTEMFCLLVYMPWRLVLHVLTAVL